ncbi:alternative ribosome rescue aminoacyl-tRNA hydrolase ArfB [Porphyrobacter sp. CACIAM 03H1]|jgi:ribosome-associated protein|uniref:alternative ribosome rescue aminoacyl-tRNA hydrolase ArfB n=1 Tax=Porphyrobacter sp. CACIAM 03H1 TaxID=2003315 RepID=UPI000B5A6B35|nr:alternative ribosome rescue aminoacyl-tRNA hydrolase ArfB [Porphyrobacter sp. CACIAM 03H1]ASJ90031.1 aminoacyl-tRNA hydrolase [Porphyrobacter sp. CACIAM 03H1]
MDDEPLTARALRLASESFLAGSGPGGQNANKVATEVELRVNIYALRLSPPVFARLRKLAGAKLAGNGDLIVTSKAHRTQEANRQDARAKLAALLEEAQTEPKRRARTRLNRVGKTERLKVKKARGAVKAGRGRPSASDW